MKPYPMKMGGWLAAACLTVVSLSAADFYVDPVNGSMSGDGSQANPWSSLQTVLDDLVETEVPQSKPYDGTGPLKTRNVGAPVQPGDTLKLLSGDHGDILVQSFQNPAVLTIEAAEGETPVLRSFLARGGKNWALRGLTISPEPYGTLSGGVLVNFQRHSYHGPVSDGLVEDCSIYTVQDTSAWTAQDWVDNAGSGIISNGPNMTFRNNDILNVANGITINDSNGLVEYNTVNNFSADGLRVKGDYGVFQYNLVMNCYNVDGNHDDGFQSWTDGGSGPGSGVLYGIELRGNIFIETDDPTRALNGPLQGIGCFDGMFEDWVIENNLIIVEQWHAITLLGATNCVIANNTVVHQDLRSARPWIKIGSHKNGAPSSGNVVVNNIARSFSLPSGTISSNNLAVAPADYASYFKDVANFDARLVSGSPAIDAGTSSNAPSDDLMGNSRPQGAGYDVGAYEYAPSTLIHGVGSDTQLNDDGTTPWLGGQTARVGGSTNVLEGVMIYVFQLPTLDAGETILDANLDFTLLNIDNATFAGEADLYGIPYRSSNSVISSDFYHGTYGSDAGATELQQGIMSNTEPTGLISTDASGDWNLTDYINAQYDNGAVGGDYVFLRVNSSETDHSPYRYWRLATANHATLEYRPALSVEIGDE